MSLAFLFIKCALLKPPIVFMLYNKNLLPRHIYNGKICVTCIKKKYNILSYFCVTFLRDKSNFYIRK